MMLWGVALRQLKSAPSETRGGDEAFSFRQMLDTETGAGVKSG